MGGWRSPETRYFSLLGVLAMLLLQPVLSSRVTRGLTVTCLILVTGIAAGRAAYLVHFPRHARNHVVDAFYPYESIAETIRSMQPEPANIAGSRFLVSGISAYMTDHPRPYHEWDPRQSPWASDELLAREGAVFAWEESDRAVDALPGAIQSRFPRARFLTTRTFPATNPRQRHNVTVAFAILPPQ